MYAQPSENTCLLQSPFNHIQPQNSYEQVIEATHEFSYKVRIPFGDSLNVGTKTQGLESAELRSEDNSSNY